MRKNISFRDTAQHKRALEKVKNRDRGKYPTAGDYIAAALLAFESHHKGPISRAEVEEMIAEAIAELRADLTGGKPATEETPIEENAPGDTLQDILTGHIFITDSGDYVTYLTNRQTYCFKDNRIVFTLYHKEIKPAENVDWQRIRASIGESKTDAEGRRYITLKDKDLGETWTWTQGENQPRKNKPTL